MATTTGTTNQTSQSRSRVTIPKEIRRRGSTITQGAMGAYWNPAKGNQYDYDKYKQAGVDMTGQMNEYHDAAGQQYDKATGYQPYIDRADAAATSAASANPAQTMNGPNYNWPTIQGFMNPYQQGVIDEGMQQIDDQLTQQRLANQEAAARSGAFGGARHGVIDAQAQETAADTKANFLANQLSQGFGQAVNQYNTDFNQQATATTINNAAAGQNYSQGADLSGRLASLGQQQQNQQLAAGDAQLKLGEVQRSQEDQQKQNAYNYGYMGPMNVYERLAAINAMQPHNRTSTGTTKTTGYNTQDSGSNGWLGAAIGAAGQIAGSIPWSDERTKTDVKDRDPEEILKAFAEIKPVTYRYRDDLIAENPGALPAGERRGFMAQDLERVFGRKSGLDYKGYKTVDYHDVIGDLVAAVKGLEKRTRRSRRAR